VARAEGDDQLSDLTFQDQVWLWLEVWSADRPELREEARRLADPAVDPWGYLAHLGELILAAE
jgi:hypothetical protein